MVGFLVAVGCISHVHIAVCQHQRGPLILHEWVESLSRYGRGALRQIRTGREVEFVQTLCVARPIRGSVGTSCTDNHVQHAPGFINDRRANDAHVSVDVEATELEGFETDRCAKVHMPNRLLRFRIVRVESVNTVVYRRHIHDVMRAAVDLYSCDYERLRVKLVIDDMLELHAKLLLVNVCRCQNCFCHIRAGPKVVVVFSDDIDLCAERHSDKKHRCGAQARQAKQCKRSHLTILHEFCRGGRDGSGGILQAEFVRQKFVAPQTSGVVPCDRIDNELMDVEFLCHPLQPLAYICRSSDEVSWPLALIWRRSAERFQLFDRFLGRRYWSAVVHANPSLQ